MKKKWFDVVLILREYGNSLVMSVPKEFVTHHKMVIGQTYSAKVCLESENGNGEDC